MNEIRTWLDTLQCPDCRKSSFEIDRGNISCAHCDKIFEQSEGIWNFLPTSISHRKGKDKERQGWRQRFEDEKKGGWDPPPELFLQLPYYPYPYYEEAAEYMEIVMQYGKPWQGKKFLELGAAECWATRHFAQAGAQAAALDYDPARMIKAQIILDKLPIRFPRFMGDGENLPFKDKSVDCVFCCSVLHHFFDLPKAVREISRILKPGGTFFAIHEAFHPPYFSKEKIMGIHEDTPMNIGYGINEQSFTAGYYRKIFRKAGLNLDLIHPRWDTRHEGKLFVVKPGAGIHRNIHYVPDILNAAAERKGLIGKVSDWLLRSEIWRLATHPKVFPMLRFHLLNWTQKTKIITAKKPSSTGAMATRDLWIRALIHTEEKGPTDGIWQKSGEGVTSEGIRTIWGYFYANPNEVYWGIEENPEIFVKMEMDPDGRTRINFFHASVPDTEVFSDCPYNGKADARDTLAMNRRYVRHYFENGKSASCDKEKAHGKLSIHVPGNEAGTHCELAAIDDLRIGAILHAEDQGPVSAAWRLGGEGFTSRGDQVVWGYFHAHASGDADIPLVFVKIWFDMGRRLYVNFFHVSDQDVEVFSDFVNTKVFNHGKIRVMDERYVRYEYWRQ